MGTRWLLGYIVRLSAFLTPVGVAFVAPPKSAKHEIVNLINSVRIRPHQYAAYLKRLRPC